MIITISGLPGAGKTTVGKLLAVKLGYTFFSVGDLRGRMAMGKGLTIEQLNRIGEKEDWTDREADEYVRKLADKDNMVVEGRMAFHFIPASFKIFLEVGLAAGAERIFRDQRPDEYGNDNPDDVRRAIEKRVKSDEARYNKIYGIDFLDRKHYNLVVDTTELTPEQAVETILEHIKGKRDKQEV